jgi:hypothetical protein
VFLFLIGIFLGGCVAPAVPQETPAPLEPTEESIPIPLTDSQRLETDTIRQFKAQRDNRLEQEKAFNEKAVLKQALLDRTYYAPLTPVALYEDIDLLRLRATVDPKSPIVLKEVILTDGSRKIGVVDTIKNKPTDGYVPYEQLVKDPSQFIGKPYAGVDYSRIEKAPDYPDNPRVVVKGVYVSQTSLGSAKLQELIQLAKETEINAFVIDVVDDYGNTLFFSQTAEGICPEANGKSGIRDLASIIKTLKENDIYLIGRVVTFRSPRYAAKYPERAIVYRETGDNYKQGDGLAWGSAYDETLWAYAIGIAKEAAAIGFNEIQFDYVRFPATGDQLDRQLDYNNETDRSKVQAIQDFLIYAKTELLESRVYITADVFGWSASDFSDVQIGQHWEAISNVVDYIAPMMYPSHYGPGNFGLPVPDAEPYKTILRSGEDALDRNANLQVPAAMRPWIQDFTATWVKGHIRYGAEALRAQIQALEDLGIEEFMLWNPRNNYHREGLKKEAIQ